MKSKTIAIGIAAFLLTFFLALNANATYIFGPFSGNDSNQDLYSIFQIYLIKIMQHTSPQRSTPWEMVCIAL